MTEKKTEMECIICLEKILLQDLFISDFCECRVKFHLTCYNEYFLENLKCMICKKYHYQYIMNLIIYDFEKSMKIYKTLLNNNYLHICDLNNIKISNHITIKINNKYNTTYLDHHGINLEIINGLKIILDKTKYKIKIITEIKKSIEMEFD